MTTTPPVRPIVEPPTPLYGGRIDDYQPYSVRKSSRISNRCGNRTPSPPREERTTRHTGTSTPRRSTRNLSSSHTYSPPSSNPSSPHAMSHRKAQSGTGAHAKKLLGDELMSDPIEGTSAAMLPTPVKTPRKKDIKELKPASRVLFPNRPGALDDAMPNPRKRARRHVGYSLQSFEDSPSGGPGIEIYTDSKEKLPEIDESADNPFYVKPNAQRRPNKKSKAPKQNSKNEEVQQVLENDEGMVYVFRGKKIYRKFEADDDDAPPDGIESATDGLALDQFETPRRFTRSSIKPRLLFPSATAQQSSLTDEEAPTDIEEQNSSEPEIETPSKPSFAPATPPETNRVKRTAKRAMLDTPAGESGADSDHGKFTVKRNRLKTTHKTSPFDGWQRGKAGQSAAAKGKKRGGGELERVEESKRVRS